MKPDSANRIAVLGTGAMGSLFAARLARAIADERLVGSVTVSGTWRAALEAMRRDGIEVREPNDSWRSRVRVATHDDLGDGFDLVLVLGKSAQTPAVAPVAARARSRDGLILSLQNGLGHVALLRAAAGAGSVAAGITTAGATVVAPGVIRWGGADGCVIGVPRGESIASARLDAACQILRTGGFDARRTDDLDAARWLKLAINCAANPLTALARIENGALIATASRRRVTLAIAVEVAAVARAAGIAIEDAEVESRLLTGITASAENHSSMLQDMAGGRTTEIEALCGSVVAVAARHGVAAPLNTWLRDAVRLAELPSMPTPATRADEEFGVVADGGLRAGLRNSPPKQGSNMSSARPRSAPTADEWIVSEQVARSNGVPTIDDWMTRLLSGENLDNDRG